MYFHSFFTRGAEVVCCFFHHKICYHDRSLIQLLLSEMWFWLVPLTGHAGRQSSQSWSLYASTLHRMYNPYRMHKSCTTHLLCSDSLERWFPFLSNQLSSSCQYCHHCQVLFFKGTAVSCRWGSKNTSYSSSKFFSATNTLPHMYLRGCLYSSVNLKVMFFLPIMKHFQFCTRPTHEHTWHWHSLWFGAVWFQIYLPFELFTTYIYTVHMMHHFCTCPSNMWIYIAYI